MSSFVEPSPLVYVASACKFLLGTSVVFCIGLGVYGRIKGRPVENSACWCRQLSILSILAACFFPILIFVTWELEVSVMLAPGVAREAMMSVSASEALIMYSVFCGISIVGFAGNALLAIPGKSGHVIQRLEQSNITPGPTRQTTLRHLAPIIVVAFVTVGSLVVHSCYHRVSGGISMHIEDFPRYESYVLSAVESNELAGIARRHGTTGELEALSLTVNATGGVAYLSIKEVGASYPTGLRVEKINSKWIEERRSPVTRRESSFYPYLRTFVWLALTGITFLVFVIGAYSPIEGRRRNLCAWACHRFSVLAVLGGLFITAVDLANWFLFAATHELPVGSLRTAIHMAAYSEALIGLALFFGSAILAFLCGWLLSASAGIPLTNEVASQKQDGGRRDGYHSNLMR